MKIDAVEFSQALDADREDEERFGIELVRECFLNGKSVQDFFCEKIILLIDRDLTKTIVENLGQFYKSGIMEGLSPHPILPKDLIKDLIWALEVCKEQDKEFDIHDLWMFADKCAEQISVTLRDWMTNYEVLTIKVTWENDKSGDMTFLAHIEYIKKD